MTSKSEVRFAKMIEGVNFSPAEIAILRRDLSMPYDEEVLRMHLATPSLEKRLTILAWSKINKPTPSTAQGLRDLAHGGPRGLD